MSKTQWLNSNWTNDGHGASRLCRVCCKKKKHFSHNCPYLTHVPHGATVGPGYDIVCKCCNQLNGHPGRYWEGRAVVTFCTCCMTMGQHPYEKCPYRPKDRAPFVPRTVVVWSALDTPPYESPVPDVY
ncbi:hypothetical protein FF1_035467 [Malus domestica]